MLYGKIYSPRIRPGRSGTRRRSSLGANECTGFESGMSPAQFSG
jgi:hypothetical protein